MGCGHALPRANWIETRLPWCCWLSMLVGMGIEHLAKAYHALSTSDRISLLGALATFLGVFVALFVGIVGAWFASVAGAKRGAKTAFELARVQQKQDVEDKQYSALVATQYALSLQWNTLQTIWKSFLLPHKDKPNRHFAVPRFYSADHALRVPFGEIGFIAETNNANLLQHIFLAEEAYVTSMNIVSMLGQRRDALDRSQDVEVSSFNETTGECISKPLNPRAQRDAFYMGEVLTNLYKSMEKTLPILEQRIKDVEQFMLEYCGRRGLQITKKDDGLMPLSVFDTNKPTINETDSPPKE